MTRLLGLAKLGTRSITLHMLRSFLTALGIIIGVAAVIFMLAVVEGNAEMVQQKIRARGANNIIIKAKKPQDEESAQSTRQRMVIYGLTYEDAERVNSSFSEVEVIVPVRKVNNSIYYGPSRVDSVAMGTVPWYENVAKLRMARGRWIHDKETKEATPVAVLGATLTRKLFGFHDPLGDFIRIGSKPFRVIGVLEPVVTDDLDEALERDGAAYIPITAVRERFGEVNVKTGSGNREIEKVDLHEILVRVKDMNSVLPVSRAIEELLDRTHRQDDYELVVPLKLLDEAKEEADRARLMFGTIAAISLLVGGIGIMNIMLASVTERTREIGVRRALGALRRDITIQFLMETLILAVIGGLMGIGLGIGASFLYETKTGEPTIVTVASVVLSFGISGLVGIVAGLYPAVRAARMDPIRALRHE